MINELFPNARQGSRYTVLNSGAEAWFHVKIHVGEEMRCRQLFHSAILVPEAQKIFVDVLDVRGGVFSGIEAQDWNLMLDTIKEASRLQSLEGIDNFVKLNGLDWWNI